MDALAQDPLCIVCGRQIHGETVTIDVNSWFTAPAHPECAK